MRRRGAKRCFMLNWNFWFYFSHSRKIMSRNHNSFHTRQVLWIHGVPGMIERRNEDEIWNLCALLALFLLLRTKERRNWLRGGKLRRMKLNGVLWKTFFMYIILCRPSKNLSVWERQRQETMARWRALSIKSLIIHWPDLGKTSIFSSWLILRGPKAMKIHSLARENLMGETFPKIENSLQVLRVGGYWGDKFQLDRQLVGFVSVNNITVGY